MQTADDWLSPIFFDESNVAAGPQSSAATSRADAPADKPLPGDQPRRPDLGILPITEEE